MDIVEKASELAHKDLCLMVDNELNLYTTDDNGDLKYRDRYQIAFDELYDEYYKFLNDNTL